MQSLCRASRSAGLAKQTQLVAPQNVRHMATGKQIKQRMVSVASIKKITKAMKMVSASKLRGVQQNLENSRKFAAGPASSWPTNEKAPAPQKVLYVPLTSDRGLCGAVNSSIVRSLRPLIEESITEKKEVQVLPVGEKGRAIMERKYREHFEMALSEIGKKKAPTFADASVAAELILQHKFDECVLYYNKFKNAISYITTAIRVPSLSLAMSGGAPQFYGVNFGPHPLTSRLRILEDLYEFRLASLMYQGLCESATSEQSSRMNAMEASSKNADEMFNTLTLSYNKARQAKITGELMEIVGGTTALADSE